MPRQTERLMKCVNGHTERCIAMNEEFFLFGLIVICFVFVGGMILIRGNLCKVTGHWHPYRSAIRAVTGRQCDCYICGYVADLPRDQPRAFRLNRKDIDPDGRILGSARLHRKILSNQHNVIQLKGDRVYYGLRHSIGGLSVNFDRPHETKESAVKDYKD